MFAALNSLTPAYGIGQYGEEHMKIKSKGMRELSSEELSLVGGADTGFNAYAEGRAGTGPDPISRLVSWIKSKL